MDALVNNVGTEAFVEPTIERKKSPGVSLDGNVKKLSHQTKTYFLVIISVLFCHSALCQTNLVKTLPTGKDSRIIYLRAEKVFHVEIPDYNSSLNELSKNEVSKKGFSFQEGQWSEVVKLFDKYGSYSMSLEENKIKSFSKTLGKVMARRSDKPGEITLEFTILVDSQGQPKLLLEETDEFLNSTKLVVMDGQDVRSSMELIRLVPDLQKESADSKN